MPADGKHTRVVVLCGYGLGEPLDPIPSGLAWDADPDAVRRTCDDLRMTAATRLPGDAHEALSRMQHAVTVGRCTLATLEVEGLLQKASAEHVIELNGSLFRSRCAASPDDHPRIGVFGPQDPARCCALCGSPLRPDVALPTEAPMGEDRLTAAIERGDLLLTVGVDPDSPLLQRLLPVARGAGVVVWGVHAGLTVHPFDAILALDPNVAVPQLVQRWLREEAP